MGSEVPRKVLILNFQLVPVTGTVGTKTGGFFNTVPGNWVPENRLMLNFHSRLVTGG